MVHLPGGSFNANEQGDMNSFEPLPAGTYLARIIDSEVKPTSSGTGHFLLLIFQIMTPGFEKRQWHNRLNLDNPSEKAVDIANRELGAICKACGKSVVKDTEEIYGIPMSVTLKITPASANFSASNDATAYEAAVGSTEVSVGAAFGSSGGSGGSAASAAVEQKPWEQQPQVAEQPAASAAEEKPPWA